MQKYPWTIEGVVRTFGELILQGLSLAEIAKALTTRYNTPFTRGAVCGKLYRLETRELFAQLFTKNEMKLINERYAIEKAKTDTPPTDDLDDEPAEQPIPASYLSGPTHGLDDGLGKLQRITICQSIACSRPATHGSYCELCGMVIYKPRRTYTPRARRSEDIFRRINF